MNNEELTNSRITRLEEDVSSLNTRLSKLAIQLATTSEKLNSVLITLGEIKATVLALQQKPAKRLEYLISSVLSSIISLVIGFLFAKFI